MKKYLNNKGSAMILVLSSLVILSAVGAVVVMLSAANITMSRKYSNWSSEYYSLDFAAQERLAELDRETLIPGENTARYYLQNGYYQYDSTGDFPSEGTGGLLQATISTDLQNLMHEKWLDIYAILTAGDADPDESYQDQYDAEMESFIKDAFKVLYFAYVDHNLASYISVGTMVASNGIPTSVSLQSDADWFPPDISGYLTFDALCAGITDMPQVAINASDLSVNRQVDVRVTVVPPSYSAVEQTKYMAVMVNPLYTNALSSQGGVTFTGSGNTVIAGDVASNNIGGGTGRFDEGNEVGIKTARNHTVNATVYGNVYSAGDVHLWGNGSSIRIREYSDMPGSLFSGFTASLKSSLYNNDYYLDFSTAGSGAGLYTEGFVESYLAANPSSSLYIPFIYRDSAGGNVYCNNLSVEKSVTGATLSVAGNVWTRDDVQNDGSAGSGILVQKNYIGLRSDADENNKDPNASSSIINNAFQHGGTIRISGDYIIPGTAWYKFASVNNPPPASNPVYYQSAESISARAGEYFQIYAALPGESASTYYISAEEYYDLFERNPGSSDEDVLYDRIDRFTDALASLAGLKSGIDLSPSASRYMLGVGVNDDGVLVSTGSDITNGVAYADVGSVVLPRVFDMKTLYYGTSDFTFNSLTNSAFGISDPSNRFYYYGGDTTLNVGSISSGIVYCAGNLHITGSGTFSGSVICAGDVTIGSGVTLYYSEDAVKAVLGVSDGSAVIESTTGSRIARRFFSPGGFLMGTSLGTEQISTISATAGERDGSGVKRYVVNSWRESGIS